MNQEKIQAFSRNIWYYTQKDSYAKRIIRTNQSKCIAVILSTMTSFSFGSFQPKPCSSFCSIACKTCFQNHHYCNNDMVNLSLCFQWSPRTILYSYNEYKYREMYKYCYWHIHHKHTHAWSLSSISMMHPKRDNKWLNI